MIEPKNEEYIKISKQISFIAKDFLRINDSAGLFIAIGTIGTQKVTLKIIPLTFGPRINWTKKDVSISNLLSAQMHDDFKVLKILNQGETAKSYWFMREYIDGVSLSEFREEGFLTGYDVINDKFLSKPDVLITRIIKILKSFRALKINSKQALDYQRFPLKIDEEAEKLEHQLGINLTKARRMISKNLKSYFSKSNKIIMMGDFSPSNIIIKNDDYYLFDFEHYGIDNNFVDIAYLWLFLWRYESWQKVLIEKTVRNDEDKTSFVISLVRIILFIYNYKMTEINQDSMDKDLSELKDFIWWRYLEASNESFDAVINTK